MEHYIFEIKDGTEIRKRDEWTGRKGEEFVPVFVWKSAMPLWPSNSYETIPKYQLSTQNIATQIVQNMIQKDRARSDRKHIQKKIPQNYWW